MCRQRFVVQSGSEQVHKAHFLEVLGGILLEICHEGIDARQRGMKVMVGCMTESTVGISAIAQLLPLLDYVDMDGAALLAEDIADGVQVINGVCHYAVANGTGASLK